MIEVHKLFNLTEPINAFLSDRRAKQRLPPTAVATQGAHILSQEKDGCILYTWDDVTEWSEGAIVTHFGLYNPILQQHQVIYIYSQRVHVVSCSVNRERTLMAFTVVKREAGQSSPDRRIGKETYNAYIAELQAHRRVFSLNLERYTFIKVQFLYTDSTSDKETYMLVMLHKESIGLYKIPMGMAGSKGMAMIGQPKTEHVAKKFVWCQWDAGSQQLFYIHLRHHGSEDKQSLLSCLQFYSGAQHDAVLDVPLNFPFVHRSSGRTNYADIPLHTGIPDPAVNLIVLAQSNGTFCICYQHHVHSSERKSKSSPLPRTSPLQRASPKSPYQSSPTSPDGENNEINYYVCLVHHATTLHGCVSSIPANIVKKAMLTFSWLGDLIMVTLPGHFVHLLNVAIEFEPCHHILLHNKTYTGCVSADTGDEKDSTETQSADGNMVPVVSSKDMCAVLSSEAEHFSFISGFAKDISGGNLLDRSSGTVWRATVSMDNLIQIFTDCYVSTTRTALLHYVILRTRDYSLLRKLFQVLCNDITSAEVPGLMMEYLIGMTYGSMRRQMDREVLRLLPFTLTETFRGQLDKNSEGERLARVSYSTIHSVNIGTKTAKERHSRKGNVAMDLWDTLRDHLRWMQLEKKRRFSQEMVKRAYRQLVLEEEKTSRGTTNTEEEHFLTMAKIHNSISRHDSQSSASAYTNKPDNILGSVPPFLHATAVTEMSEKLLSLTKEILSKHLMAYLHKDSKVKANNVAKEYVNCQSQQSRLLCHMLWGLRGNDIVWTPTEQAGADEVFARSTYEIEALPSLLGDSSVAEYELFQLLERYSLALTEIVFPVPQGFPSYFTAIAFRCLDIRLFMQYVNSGVLQLTGDFMAQVLKDLPDTEEYCRVKHFIISRLPQKSAEECYKQWGHTSCLAYFAQQQVDDRLSGIRSRSSDSQTAGSRKSSKLVRGNSVLDSVTFQPLAAFLRHIEQSGLDTGPPKRYSPLDITALEEVALHHTRTETSYDMGTVNF